MRASYRWLALCLFACWALLMVAAANRGLNLGTRAWALILATVVVLQLPDLPTKLEIEASYRDSFSAIDDELVVAAKQHIRVGETAAFLPYNNDFVANYLAPAAGFKTLNIGGDKNLAIAKGYWPPEMLRITAPMTPGDLDGIKDLLRTPDVDVVVLPYFPMPFAVSDWPCGLVRLLITPPEELLPVLERSCLDRTRKALRPLLLKLERDPGVSVEEADFFATVRLAR